MLHNLYSRNRFKIGQRLSTKYAINIDEWSESQFIDRITTLAEKATAPTKALAGMNIDALGDLIVKDSYSHIVYPTLLDVLAWNCIEMIEEFTDDSAQAQGLHSKLLADLASVHHKDYAPLINVKTKIGFFKGER